MTVLTQHHRDQISALINVYLDGITSISQDAGWEGDSMLAKIIEFGGAPPRGTGNDQSNVAMINAIRMLEKQHPEYRKIMLVVQVLQDGPGTKDKINALLAKHYYRGFNDHTGKAFTNIDRMGLIGQEIGDMETADGRFRYDIRCAFRLVLRELERFDSYTGVAA